jgi:hypothetical protein
MVIVREELFLTVSDSFVSLLFVSVRIGRFAGCEGSRCSITPWRTKANKAARAKLDL